MPPGRRRRRDRRAQRAVPLLLLALAAFAGGAVTGARHEPDEQRIVARFVAAWARGDYAAMHAQLAPSSKARWPLDRFTRQYKRTAAIATVQRIEPAGLPERSGAVFHVPVRARTQIFGVLGGTLALTVAKESDATGIVFSPELVLPGLRRGDKLRRQVVVPPRGRIAARDGSILAEGEARTPEPGVVPAGGIVGTVGPIPPEQVKEFEALGYPDGAKVGLSGLEREFERRLAGSFGGLLLASGRVVARSVEHQAKTVRSTIDLRIQQAAVDALATRPELGGVAVLKPQSGEVLALAGIAYSAPQPPGSTFKVITLSGVLERRIAKPSDTFPVQTAATIEGVKLQNANGESCGGSLAISFAHSCNSVFAPLGARLGASRLVETAEAFGFNEPPVLKGEAMSTIPAAAEIGDDLAVGSSAIGQGRVQATPLRLALVAAAIGNRGVYVRPTLLRGAKTKRSRAISARTARIVGRFMRLVVSSGTGTSAQIPGVTVAGKTGTAELRKTTVDPDATPVPGATPQPANDKSDTDAWFTAFAPAGSPRVAVAVLVVGAGAGGESAAPIARQVLLSALKR